MRSSNTEVCLDKMKIKRMVKRLFAVASGATMLGATAMGALAADLGNYPAVFVTDGTFDGFFVVGEAAASVDNLAMTDIAASMKIPGGGSSTTTISGDSWMVGTSSKKLEMVTTQSTPNGENIYDIEQFIGKDELGALADGSYSTTGSSSTYAQYLYFDNNTDSRNEIVAYVENDFDVTADFLFFRSGQNMGEYVLEFSSNPESSIQTTAGSASATGAVLDDYEDTTLNMLGVDYTIVLARRPEAAPAQDSSIKLTLMGGAVKGSLLEGESTTMKLGDTEYDVALTFVDDTYTKFTVNGEGTDKLQVGDTYKLADGKELGVSERLYQNYAGGVHSATFFLGASKLEMRDNNVLNSISDTVLKVGTETISGADVIIEGTDDNTTFTLSKIRVYMTAQDDYFVPAGGKLSDAIVEQGDDKELIFGNNWDIEYHGLTVETTHDIRLTSSTDRKYKLKWYDGGGNLVDMPLAYANSTTDVQLSEDATDKEVILNEGLNITKNDYFVVTGGSASDGTGKSYAFQYKGADKSGTTSPKIKFKNLGTGVTVDYSISGTTDTAATIKIGGYSFLVENVTTKTAGDFTIAVDLNQGGAVEGDAEVDIIDYYGALIDFGGTLYVNATGESNSQTGGFLQPAATGGATPSLQINITTPNSNDYDNQAPLRITLFVDGTTGPEVNVATFNINGTTQGLLTPDGEENIAYGCCRISRP